MSINDSTLKRSASPRYYKDIGGCTCKIRFPQERITIVHPEATRKARILFSGHPLVFERAELHPQEGWLCRDCGCEFDDPDDRPAAAEDEE